MGDRHPKSAPDDEGKGTDRPEIKSVPPPHRDPGPPPGPDPPPGPERHSVRSASEDAGESQESGGLETGKSPPEPREAGSAPEPGSPPEPKQHSYQEVNVPDAATEDDSLGFEPYVEAMAAFLTNPRTQGPLTVSIEGEWGSGKSSFMKQLEKALPDAAKVHGATESPIIVWFNAWRHDKAEALWAAFARALQRSFSEPRRPESGWRWLPRPKQLSFPRRWWGHAKLLWLRFHWREGWLDLVRFVVLLLALLGFAFALPLIVGEGGWTDLREWLIWSNAQMLSSLLRAGAIAGGTLAYVAIVVALFLRLRTFIGDPFSIDLRQHLRGPDYDAKAGFIEQFHKDFQRVLDAYVDRRRKVVCFIDDLDRCEVPKAADLMQALNLMLSDDYRMIFLLGMDRRKIAAGLAVKFKDLIPFLSEVDGAGGTAAGSSPPEPAGSAGLRFGHDFIEKFVQIAYSLPRTAERNLDTFLKGLTPPELDERAQPKKTSRSRRLAQWAKAHVNKLRGQGAEQEGAETNKPVPTETVDSPGGEPSGESGDESSEERRKRLVPIVKLVKSGDDPAFTNELVRMVAPVVDYNPRRLKQFINLFRLNLAIAGSTEITCVEKGSSKYPIRLEQIGKFVALRTRWPEIVEELERRPEQLVEVCRWAEGKRDWSLSYQLNRPELLRNLLRAGYMDEEGNSDLIRFASWALHHVDVRRLLEVSPAAPTVPESERSSYQEINVPDSPAAIGGLEYVLIPGGTFQMGAVPGDEEVMKSEQPRHQVAITKSFHLTKTPITVRQYKRFAEETGRRMPEAPEFNSNWEKEDHPIVGVTWEKAQAFCESAGGRLPTEAEWEYAARGGREGLKYPNGNELTKSDAHFTGTGTCPVGQFLPNGYGLLDMAGNEHFPIQQ